MKYVTQNVEIKLVQLKKLQAFFKISGQMFVAFPEKISAFSLFQTTFN